MPKPRVAVALFHDVFGASLPTAQSLKGCR